VYLPESLLFIGEKAFYDCPALIEVIYPYSMSRFYTITVEAGNEEMFNVLKSAQEAE
jgi:hypothetical protein